MPKPGFLYRNRDLEYFTGLGVENPKTDMNFGILCRSAHAIGMADFLFTCGEPKFPRQVSDTAKSYRAIPSFAFKDFDELYRLRPEACELIGVELCDRAIPIEDFKWPDRAVILLGGEDVGLSKRAVDRCRHVIKLPSNGLSMNLAAAGSMVLFHRWAQLKGNK